MLTKEQLRREMLTRLRALPAARIEALSAELRRQLISYLPPTPLHVCLYAPLPHEVNLLPLLRELPQHFYYFPRCVAGRRLSFHRVHDPATQLVTGAMGIQEPLPELPILRPEQAELVIVPGLAFTASGKRLGYGGGYYDRFLPLCSQAVTLALALPEQLLADLPCTAHDKRLHHVLYTPLDRVSPKEVEEDN